MMKAKKLLLLAGVFLLGHSLLLAQGELTGRIDADLEDLNTLQEYVERYSEVKVSLQKIMAELKMEIDSTQTNNLRTNQLFKQFQVENRKIEEQFEIENSIVAAKNKLNNLQDQLKVKGESETFWQEYNAIEKPPSSRAFQRKFRKKLYLSRKNMMRLTLRYYKANGSFMGINLFKTGRPKDKPYLDPILKFTKETIQVYNTLDSMLDGEEVGESDASALSEKEILDSIEGLDLVKIVERYRIKLEEYEDLAAKNKQLEEKNFSLGERNTWLSFTKDSLEKRTLKLRGLNKATLDSLLVLQGQLQGLKEQSILAETGLQTAKLKLKNVQTEYQDAQRDQRMSLMKLDIAEKSVNVALAELIEAEKKQKTAVENLSEAENNLKEAEENLDRLNKEAEILIADLNFQGILKYIILIIAVLTTLFLIFWLWKGKNQLKHSNKQLQLTFRELHHRTKNNLRMVAGMLGMQARSAGNKDTEAALEAGRDRLSAVILVHSKLYKGNSLSKVQMDEYVDSLLQHMIGSFDFEDSPLRLNTEVQNIRMDADFAIPIGILINEVVTNAFKHAFHDNPNPQLTIKLEPCTDSIDENEICLTIKDNGPGIPGNYTQKRTFGMEVINDLVKEQLDGEYAFRVAGGTLFQAKIKYK